MTSDDKDSTIIKKGGMDMEFPNWYKYGEGNEDLCHTDRLIIAMVRAERRNSMPVTAVVLDCPNCGTEHDEELCPLCGYKDPARNG